jgi:hypothetical protein
MDFMKEVKNLNTYVSIVVASIPALQVCVLVPAQKARKRNTTLRCKKRLVKVALSPLLFLI